MATPLPDSAIVDNLATALANSRKFQEQSADRINSMKLEVLHTYKAQENVSGNVPAKDDNKYDRNITTRIINVVEARATALEQFRKQQEEAEKTLSDLQNHLKYSKSPTSESAGKDPEMKKERDKILEHVSRIQTFRAEQVEAEGLLNKFLQLKKQAQSQDRDALRISQEIKIMESKLDGFSMEDSPPEKPAVQAGAEGEQAEALRRSSHQTANPELQRFVFNELPPPDTPCVVLGDVVSPQGVAFKAGDRVQFLRAGNKGWTLVRDRLGVPSWLPAFEVQALHTNQGVLDYRDQLTPTGSAEAVQTRTNFLNDPGSGPSSAGTPQLETPVFRQGVLTGVNGASPLHQSPPHQSPPRGSPPPAASPRPDMGRASPPRPDVGRGSLSLSPGSDSSAPAGHTGVVGLALSAGPNDDIVVAAVKPGGPASKSQKIQVGHTVTSIDGEEVSGIGGGGKGELAQVVKKLCGPAGSFVSVGLRRADGGEVEVVLVREEPQWVRASRDLASRAGSRAGSPPGPQATGPFNLNGQPGIGAAAPPPRAPSLLEQSLGLGSNLNMPARAPHGQGGPGSPLPALASPAFCRDPLAAASAGPGPAFLGPGPGWVRPGGGARPSPPPTPPRRQPLWSATSLAGPPNLSGTPRAAGPPSLQTWAAGGSGQADQGVLSPEPADPPTSPISSPLVPPDLKGSPPTQHWQKANAPGPAVPGRSNLNLHSPGQPAPATTSHQADIHGAPWLAAPAISPILVDSPMTQHVASPGIGPSAGSPIAMGAPAVPAFPNMVGGAHIPSMPPMLHVTPEIADHVPSVAGWGFPQAGNGGRVAMGVVNGGHVAASHSPGMTAKSSGHFI